MVGIGLFAILLVVAIVALRLLITVMTPAHRRRYSRVLNYSFVLGIVLGLVLPWNEQIGILAAVITSFFFLLVALDYSLLQGRTSLPILGRIVPARWFEVSRESVRDIFLFLSIVTGVIGLTTTVLSVVIPPFLSLSLGSFVPLSFDTLSVLSAMLEFTFAIPHRGIMFSLVRKHLHERLLRRLHVTNGALPDTALLTMILNDPTSLAVFESEVPSIVEGAGYSVRDIAETLDYLVKEGLAESEGTPGSRTYTLTREGFQVIQSPWEESQILIASDRRKLERNLSQLGPSLAFQSSPKPHSLRKAREALLNARKQFEKMRYDYGRLLDREWSERVAGMITLFSQKLGKN